MVAHVKIVSFQGPNPSFLIFLGDLYSTRGHLGQGLGLALGPGLDNTQFQRVSFLLMFDTYAAKGTWIRPNVTNVIFLFKASISY